MDNFFNKYGETIDKVFAWLMAISMVVILAMGAYVMVEGNIALKRQQAQIDQWRAELAAESNIMG